MFDDIDGYYDSLYDEGEVRDLNAAEVEALMAYEDNDDAIHAAAEAFAEAHDDDLTCSYCCGYGHEQDGCEVYADDKQIVAQDSARRAAKFFGADDEDMFVMGDPPDANEADEDDPWKDEFVALGQGWFENSYGDSFTLDPTVPSYDANGTELKCTCDKREDEDECFICSVGRMSPAHMWRPYRDDHDYEVYNEMGRKNRPRRQKKKQSAKTTQASLPLGNLPTATPKVTGTTSTTTTTTYVGKDSHFADPYTTYDGKLTFYLTSGRAGGNNRKEGEFVPDWGLYFDWSWRPWWRAEHIDWKDFGLPEAWDIAFEQLTVAIEKAASGDKVEMGCIGAHGRTGTALAAINVILGCSAKEAIKHVRKHHCSHAIENKKQEWWVEWVESQVTGKPCAPMPTTPAPKAYNSTAPGANQPCTQQSHFDAWLWLPAEKDGGVCPHKGDKCDWWAKDIVTFYDGKFVTWAEANYKKTPLTGNTTVCGYVVPQATYTKGAVNHNAAKFKDNDCWCDVCRYLEKGYGALLRPSDSKLGTEHDEAMWEMETKAKLAMANRKLAFISTLDLTGLETPVEAEFEETIQVAVAGGEIISVAVTSDFTPKPPPTNAGIKHGTKKNDYTYLDGRGWVWNGQLAANK